MTDIDKAKIFHFVGIGGCGMSAIAKILREMGKEVQGSDQKESSNTIRLKDISVKVFIGHDASNVRGSDVVVYSSAIAKENVEIKAARSSRIPVIARADALSWIMDQFSTRIAVAGTHGKTTTTSMISTMLKHSGQNPTYLIGAEADTIEGNATLGTSNYSIAEADESDGSFLKLHPTISVITNIEPDHMEYYKTFDKLMDTFEAFARSLPKNGLLVINSDHENNKALIKRLSGQIRIIKYGFEADADLIAKNLSHNTSRTTFDVHYKGELLGALSLSVPGRQNVQNSLAAITIGLELGLSFTQIRDSLRFFQGVKRRFQTIGEVKGITVVDDYAHHPTELEQTLLAARLGWGKGKRIICVFQPHRYTRTMYLHKDFGVAFKDADIVIITEIYSAGEHPIDGVSAKLIAEALKKDSAVEVHYIPKKDKICDFLLDNAKAGDMIITAGAGDIYTVGKEFLARLKAAAPSSENPKKERAK